MSKPPSSQPPGDSNGHPKGFSVAGTETDGLPGADAIVCFCHSVTARQILFEIGQGAKTLEEIQDRTRAATGCGGCKWDVLDLLSSV
jgi:NAD(P)H-nitrite reductase large subunit